MRKVLRNSAEVVYFWANQLQSEGRAGNIFFEGNAIYSYGHHYQIARIITDNNGKKVAFINSNGYSNSTAKHTNHVKRAIPLDMFIFNVPFFRSSYNGRQSFEVENLPAVIEALKTNVKSHLLDQINARSRSWLIRKAERVLLVINEISERFDFPLVTRNEFPNWEKAEEKANHIIATEGERKRKAELNRLKKQAEQAEQAKIEAEKVEKWERGEINGSFYNVGTRLRLSKDGKEIETSKGARVPLADAKAMYDRLKAGIDCYRERLGGYTVLDSDSNAVTIGCHVITWHVADAFFAKIA
ncbi:MAG: hypothetical protein [Podoviridae sp. ctrTa16]|nr:MAG: hypothetical protein [Podoviridae sp. ctrTa16]